MTVESEEIATRKPVARSKISNRPGALIGVDGRTAWARRFRDLVHQHMADLGGEDRLSQAELTLINRAATLTCELERMDTRFAEAGEASRDDLDTYQKTAGALRRLLESIGLERRARDVTHDLKAYVEARGAVS